MKNTKSKGVKFEPRTLLTFDSNRTVGSGKGRLADTTITTFPTTRGFVSGPADHRR